MSDDGWEELGRDISNNTHLKNVYLNEGALNDRTMQHEAKLESIDRCTNQVKVVKRGI